MSPISKRITVLEYMTSKELLAFMHKHGISESEMGQILGITPGAIRHWLSGERQMSQTTTRLIRLFDRNPELLKEF